MFGNLVALLLVVIGAGSIVFSGQLGFEANPMFLGTRGLMAVGGIGYFVYAYGSNALGLLSVFKRSVSAKPDSKIFVPEDYHLVDNSALYQLQQRCSDGNSSEGLDLVAKLAAVLFQLDLKKKV